MKKIKRKVNIYGTEFTVISLDAGDTVLCDLCNKDYTEDIESMGGLLFNGKAVCPECFDEFMKLVRHYREEKFIKAVARPDETFRNFVYRIRKEF